MALLRLFGHPVLERDGTRTQIGVPHKAVALLAILAANHTRPLSRDWLAQSLWPDDDPADARANLRRQLHLLSKAVCEDLFVLTRHTAQWNSTSQISADVVRFDTLTAAESALALQEYGGDLCAGIKDELLEGLRLRYRSQYEALLRKLTDAARAAGDDSSLALWLQRAVNHDPFDESSVRELMELRERHGDRAGALREYHALAQRLRAELAVDPEPQTAAVFNRILYGGEPPSVPNNLIASPTSFVGRDDELASIARHLKEARFVSIIGPGGVGKSRLALRAASNALREFPGGVWFVELVNADSEYAVWSAIADVLGVTAGENRDDAVVSALRRATLIVLDNCEHVAQAASRVAGRLLDECAASLITTGRRRLETDGERCVELQPFAVPPEQLPDGQSLLRYPAYRLFIERATTISPAFRVQPAKAPTLARILRRLDGLPLAIELVASRAHMLTLEGMLKRLAAANSAIESTIAWSYDLLSPQERRVFARLGAFHGKFSIDAVEAICGGEPAVSALFESVEASLARALPAGDDVQYSLLATTREFARARLRESGEEQAALRAHASYFASLVERAAELDEAAYDRLFAGLHYAMDDFVAALEWCIEVEDVETGAAIANGICRERQRRGYSRELLTLLEKLLAGTGAAVVESPQLARTHRSAGFLANTCGDAARARFHNQRAYEIYRRTGDAVSAAYARAGIALAAQLAGNYSECEQLLRETVSELEHCNHTPLLASTLNVLAELLITVGRLSEAQALSLRAAQLHRDLGESAGLGLSLKNLALIAYNQNDYAAATNYLGEVLERHAIDNDVYGYVEAMNLQADVLRSSGQPGQALEQHVAALEFLDRLAGSHLLAQTFESAALTMEACGDLRSAALLAGGAQGLRSRMRAPMDSRAAREFEALRERLRGQLGDAQYDALWLRGQTDGTQALATLGRYK